jgi:predicted lipid-binding transport protein (Tim44 family)
MRKHMKRLLTLLTVAFTCLALFSPVAEAKRFGGGGSFGKQRTMPQRQTQRAPDPTPAKPASTPATPGGNKWLGPLAGLAIGAGLASMFVGGGFGGGFGGGAMGSILLALLAAGVVMFLVSRFRKPQQPTLQYAGAGAPYHAPESQPQPVYGASASSVAASFAANIPHDFPVDQFLRNAKTSFIRLQAANDRKDLDDIREYTTPEMYAEISMQLQERGDAAQKTDVLSINAELLEVAEQGDYSIASVRFTGQLSENKGVPENVDEIWHVQKDQRNDKSVWLLAGIQQTTLM